MFTIALAEDIAELIAENKETQQLYADLLAQQKEERAKCDKDVAEAQQRYEDSLTQPEKEVQLQLQVLDQELEDAKEIQQRLLAQQGKNAAEAQKQYADLLAQKEQWQLLAQKEKEFAELQQQLLQIQQKIEALQQQYEDLHVLEHKKHTESLQKGMFIAILSHYVV